MRYCLIIILSALSLAPCLAQTPDSLYDAAHSRKIEPGLEHLLGPKSVGNRYDQRMIRAAEIALKRAHQKTTWHCWRSVKDALLASQAISSRPTSAWAKQAGEELCAKFGFMKLNITDPYRAPVGAVIVYGGADAGHVELRTPKGFVSDFISQSPYPRPLVGVFVKPIPG
jgi:hypothetical protein